MPNRNGTGPGCKRSQFQGKGRCRAQTERRSVISQSRDKQEIIPGKVINTIKFVTIGFSALILPSIKLFAKLLDGKREEGVPKLEHRPKEKTIEISKSD